MRGGYQMDLKSLHSLIDQLSDENDIAMVYAFLLQLVFPDE